MRVPVEGLRSQAVTALARDYQGGLWVGTGLRGLHRLVRRGNGWSSERVRLPEGPEDETITRIVVEPEGRVWVASNQGLAVLEGRDWIRLGLKEGLKERHVYTLARTPAGQVWVGYWSARGLSRLEHGREGWRVVQHLDKPEVLFDQTDDGLVLEARVPAELLPAVPPGSDLQVSLAAVVERKDGTLEYWALRHAAAQPDFHARDTFVLTLATAMQKAG